MSRSTNRHSSSLVSVALSATLAAAVLLLGRSIQAAIAIQDASQNWQTANTQGAADAAFSQNETFTVTPGASYLIVEYADFFQNNAGTGNPVTTVTWNGSTTLTALPVEPSSSGTFCDTQIFYTYLPTAVSGGTLNVSGNDRGGVIAAFTINGASSAAPTFAGSNTLSSNSATLTVPSATMPGSFAAIIENTRSGTTWTTTASQAPVPVQQFGVVHDLGNFIGVGGAYDLGLTGGSETITGTNSANQARISVDAAIFSPISYTTWAGNGTGLTASNWTNPLNWAGGTPPGSTSGTTSPGAAYFNNGIGSMPIVIDSSSQNVAGMEFDTGAGNFIVGTGSGVNNNPLLLTGGSSLSLINATSGVTNAQIINAPLVIEGANATYNFTNNASTTSATLTFTGAISAGTAGTTVLTLGGTNTGNNTISGAISDGSATHLSLATSGGTWVLSNASNSYTGATTVNGGTLRVTGSLPNGTTVTVGGAGAIGTPTLAGTGTINGPVVINGANGGVAGILAPSAGGTAPTTLTIANSLTLGTGSILSLTLSPSLNSGNDQVVMTGNHLLTIGTSGTVNITAAGGLALGNYVLISNSGGTISGGAGWTTGTVTGDSGHSYVLGAIGTNFDLTVAPTAITWTGSAGNGVWDTTSTNWTPAGTGKYVDGDPVIFDNTGTNTTITLNGATFSPASMTFNNTSGTPYVFNNGTLAGTGPLALTQNGTVTFNNTNNFTGGTSITNGGTINVNGTYSSGLVTVSGTGSNINVALGASLAAGTNMILNTSGAAAFNNGSQVLGSLNGDSTGSLTLNGTALTVTGGGTMAGLVSGSGAGLTVSTGSLTLSNGANSYSGGTTINNGGTLTIANDGIATGTNTPLGAIPVSPTTNLSINGGTLRATGTFTLNANRSIALGPTSGSGSGTFDVTGSNNLTIAGAIANNGSGSATLIKTDTGTLTLTGTNSYSAVQINGGTLQATGSSNLGGGGITLGGGAAGSTLTFFNPGVTNYITGINTAGFQLNGSGTASINNTNSTLTLTLNNGNTQANSAIYTTKVPVNTFTAQFTYQDVTVGGADGATFFIQNNSTTSVGGGGGGLGYNGNASANSVAFAMNIFSNPTGVGVNSNLTANGNGPTTAATGSVNIASGDPILVQLNYNGTTLNYTLTDQTTLATFSNSAAVSIPSFMAGNSNSAFVGFTGGTGGVQAVQTISNFTYSSSSSSTPLAISNSISVSNGSTGTIGLGSFPSATIPSLAIGSGSTLNVNGASLTSTGGTSFGGSATLNPGLGVTLTTGPVSGSIGSGGTLTKGAGGTLNVNNNSDPATTFSGATVNIIGGSLSTLAGTITSGLGTSNWVLNGGNLTITGTAVSGSGLSGSFWPLSPGDNGLASPYNQGTGKTPNTLSSNWPTGNNISLSSTPDDATISAFGTPPTGFSNVTLPTTANVTNPPGGPAYTYSGGINFPNSGNTVNALAAIGINISGGNGTAGTGGNSAPYSGTTSGYNSITAQWKGTVTLATAGTLNLAVNSDDFAAIAVDGTIVAARGNGGTGFNANGGGAATSPGGGNVASVSLTAGTHSIEVLYDEGGGGWGIITGYNFNGGGTNTSSFPFAIGQNDSTDGISFGGPLAGPTLSNLISVSGASSITLNAGTGTSLGALTMNNGANLTVNGTSTSATFANTVVNGSVTFSNTIPVNTAVVSNGANPAFTSLTMTGSSLLFLDNTGNTAFASGTKIHAGSGAAVTGTVVGVTVGGVDSLGAATLDVDGGTFSLGGDVSVAFANPITLSANGTIIAQALGGGAIAGNTISLSGGIATGNTAATTLTLNTGNNYTLNLTSAITGSGTVTDIGTVNLNAANPSYTGTFNVTNGTTTDNTVGALATATAVNVNAGILNVQAADTLKTLTSNGGNTNINVSGVTLSGTATVNSGGTVSVAGALAASGPINVIGGGTLNIANAGNLTNAALALGVAGDFLQPTALTVVTGAGSLGSGTVNVNSNAELRLSGGTGVSNYAGSTINLNNGLVHVTTGSANLGTAVIAGTPRVAGGTDGLTGYLFPALSGGATPPYSTAAGVLNLINGTTTPTNGRILTAVSTPHADGLDFLTDAELGNWFGNAAVASNATGNYTSVFFGHFKAPTTGSYNLAITGIDDNAAIYVDTANGTNFTQVATASGAGPSTTQSQGTPGTVSLTAGQVISVAFAMQDTGGGSRFQAGIELAPAPANPANNTYTPVGPGVTAQLGDWSYDTTTGGGTIQVDASASLAAGGFTTASNVSLANGATMTLSAPSNNFTSSTTQLSVIGTTPTATFGFAGSNNHTVNVKTLSIVTGGTLNLANSGAAAGVLNLTGAGDAANTGTLRVGSGASLSGTGSTSGSVTVLSGGTILGTIGNPTPLTIGQGLTLSAGSNSTFNLTAAGVGNSTALIAVTGGLTVNSTANITLGAGSTITTGTYDLFSFGSNANSFTASSFNYPTSVGIFTLVLSVNNVTDQVDLTVSAPPFTWTGNTNGTGPVNDVWDSTQNPLASTAPNAQTNWGNLGVASTFSDGKAVMFGDANAVSAGNPPDGKVYIANTGVNPTAVTFANSTVPYSINPSSGAPAGAGSGAIGDFTGTHTTVTVNGGGSVTFNTPNTYTGATTVSGAGSKLIILPDGSSGDTALGTAPGSATPGSIVLAGGGTLRAAGSLTLHATRGITLGTVASDNGTLDVSSGSTVAYAGAIADGSGGGDSLNTTPSGGTLILTGANTYTGATNVNGGTLQLGNGSANGSLASTSIVVASGATFALDPGSSIPSFSAVVSGQGGLLLNSDAFATVTLAPASQNTYTGGTTVAKGILQLGNAFAWNNNGGSGTALTVGGGSTSGVFDLNGNNPTVSSLATGGSLAASNQIITNSGGSSSSTAATLNFAGGATPSTFGGSIQEGVISQVSLTVSSGALHLTGSNSFSGGATINGGTLYADGPSSSGGSSTGTGSVVVSIGGTLAGIGNALALGAGGSVTVQGGGTIAGASGGTLTINGALNLNNGSLATFNLTAPNSSSTGLIAVNGSLSLGATTKPTFSLANTSSLVCGDTYDVLSYNFNSGITPTSFSLPSTFGSFNLGWTTPGNDELLLTVSGGSSGNTPEVAPNYFSGPPSPNTPTTLPTGFGTAVTWSVTSNNTYSGIGSSVANPPTQIGPGGGGPFLMDASGNPLTAAILAGNNSGSAQTSGGTANVSMSWRSRTLYETDPQDGGTPSAPPLQYKGSYLISNVLNLSGMGQGSGEPNETDPFALQMTYNPTLLSSEAAQAKKGTIYLGWLNPNGGGSNIPQWQKALTGDFNSSNVNTGVLANGGDAAANFQGSFLAFVNSVVAAEHSTNGNPFFGDSAFTSGTISSLTNAQLNDILGAYGVDTTGHDVWAVINHNSQFAVVPEPSAMLLVALGLAGLVGYRFRRKRSDALG